MICVNWNIVIIVVLNENILEWWYGFDLIGFWGI